MIRFDSSPWACTLLYHITFSSHTWRDLVRGSEHHPVDMRTPELEIDDSSMSPFRTNTLLWIQALSRQLQFLALSHIVHPWHCNKPIKTAHNTYSSRSHCSDGDVYLLHYNATTVSCISCCRKIFVYMVAWRHQCQTISRFHWPHSIHTPRGSKDTLLS